MLLHIQLSNYLMYNLIGLCYVFSILVLVYVIYTVYGYWSMLYIIIIIIIIIIYIYNIGSCHNLAEENIQLHVCIFQSHKNSHSTAVLYL